MTDHAPWDAFATRHPVGDPVTVTVTKSLPFGALVTADGVAGLLTGTDGLTAGQVVNGRIAALDADRHRFSAEPA